jgi:hypothetical protein
VHRHEDKPAEKTAEIKTLKLSKGMKKRSNPGDKME